MSDVRQPEHSYLARVSGGFLIVGTAMSLLFFFIRPQTNYDGGLEAALPIFAENLTTFAIHALGVAVGELLILGGLVGLFAVLWDDSDRAATWGLFGIAVGTVATAIAVLGSAIDGLVVAKLARTWATAPPAGELAALGVATAGATLSVVIFTRVILLYALTIVLFGVALTKSDRYPNRLGWAGVVVGAGGLLVGGIHAFRGTFVGPLAQLGFVVIVLMFVWFISVGVYLWKHPSIGRVDMAPTSPEG